MTRAAVSWLACGIVVALVVIALASAFQRYVGGDAPRYIAAGLFPCPFHTGQASWRRADTAGWR